jgi:hypothetical protein
MTPAIPQSRYSGIRSRPPGCEDLIPASLGPSCRISLAAISAAEIHLVVVLEEAGCAELLGAFALAVTT